MIIIIIMIITIIMTIIMIKIVIMIIFQFELLLDPMTWLEAGTQVRICLKISF